MKIRHLFPFYLLAVTMIVLGVFLSHDNEAVEKQRHKGPTGAMLSLQMFSEMRSFPEQDIPADKFYRAFEHSKNEMTELPNETDSPNFWTSIGPNNVGGRTLSLAFHPLDTSIIFMGSASGGLWKSTTGGLGANAWTRIETGFPSNAVSAIAIDSANLNVMYIGTGENYGYQFSQNGINVRVTRGMYGIGILKTTNGGTNWFKSLDWSYENQRGVWRVMFNPKNRNVLYAATSEGVYKTNNAGANWTQVLTHQMAMDLEINPTDTATVYVSIGNLNNFASNPNLGIYKSINSGAAWTKLTGGLPVSWSGKATIELYKGNPNFVYASIGNDFSDVGYYSSIDGGTNWTLKTTTLGLGNQGWYNNAHLIKANDPNTILIGTIDLRKSVNGGTTFTTKSNWSAWITGATPPGAPESPSPFFAHADHHEFYYNPLDVNKLYCVTDGGLYRSNDFGETFYSCNGGYVTTQFYNGFANSYQDSIWCLGGLQDNRSVFYQGTTAWYKTFSGDGMWCGVNSANDNTCYTEYTYGSISRSVNRGVSWSGISPPGAGSEANYCFSAPYIVCKSNSTVMYAAGVNIYRSNVGGGSWSNLGSVGAKSISIDASSLSTDTVYVGVIPTATNQSATIWRTTNGSTFTNISMTQIPSRYPTDIHVNPNNASDVFVVLGGFGTGHVYRSTNAGVTWINISGNLPDVPHWSVTNDPLYPQNVYVGNDLGVYVTTNNGANWFEFRTGMPYALVHDLKIVYPNRHIRAVTHGNGVYERDLVQNPVGVKQIGNEIPKSFSLGQNYPNPFNPKTIFNYELQITSYVELTVFDITGKVMQIIINKKQNAGRYEVEFDGSGLGSGVYFYKMIAGDFIDAKKMVIIK